VRERGDVPSFSRALLCKQSNVTTPGPAGLCEKSEKNEKKLVG